MPASPCRFQQFDEPSDPKTVAPRVAALRAELANRGLDGLVIPRADQHQGEYVPPQDERLAYVTGFTGSAGNAVVLADRAALIVDGRYTEQSAKQTDTAVIAPVKMEQQPLDAWLAANLSAGQSIGCDPWLHTVEGLRRLQATVEAAGAKLVQVETNPVDAIWQDRPAAPQSQVELYPEKLAGETRAAKLARVKEALKQARLGALVISDPHNLCWLFYIRGGDIGHTPLVLAYGIVRAEGPALLFLGPERFAKDDLAALTSSYPPSMLACFPPGKLGAVIAKNAKGWGKVRIDSASGGAALARLVTEAGGVADSAPDPITLMKACKNKAERAGAHAAHIRDGAAMVRFLARIAKEAPKGKLTEIDAAAMLETERLATGKLRQLSFPSISAAGPNAALPHYRPAWPSNRKLAKGIYLIDSGGQYLDGTTDITRTVAIGAPTPEMRDRYTRVLKGHIAIHLVRWPKGASGAQLDTLARMPLWEAGLDFDHGTGHGVGAYLSVHEGPGRIAKLGTTPLEEGMILSNEPGYYRPGHYGIRIENLVIVTRVKRKGDEREMLGFETLTFCPYDRALIDIGLLTKEERAFVNAYHAEVLAKIGPKVTGAALAWLKAATKKL